MFKIDLHTHSVASHDGGISLDQYKKVLRNGQLDYIAITDHNRVDFALKAKQELGEKIIVGEEIMTSQGEIIGLFLIEKIQPGKTAQETIAAIQSQAGIVYIPHPFETVRKGVSEATLKQIADSVDIIEVFNGRALLQNKSKQALASAAKHNIVGAASSDAHGLYGLATHTQISNIPNADNLVALLKAGQFAYKKPSLRSVLYPKYNSIKKMRKIYNDYS